MSFKQEMERRAREMDDQVLSYLEEGDHGELVKAMRHYPSAGGKRMRPVMAKAVAEAVGGRGDASVPFGCALEIIHNFTLVHDDVMDDDAVRRGMPAVHVAWDVPTAIIAGDAMFARGFETLATTDAPAEDLVRLVALTARSVYLVAEGQQMDMDNEGSDDVTVDRYLETIQKKTAELFACACEGGAIIGGGSEAQIASMREYAIEMGLGFQIWDDVLGIKADETKLGKPVGSDIRNGKRTLIVLHAMSVLEEHDPQRERLSSILGNEDATQDEVEEAIGILDSIGSIDHARDMALEHARRAKSSLACLRECDDREFLSDIVDYAVGRDH